MPAIAYAIDDGAPEADFAWKRLTGASNGSAVVGATSATWCRDDVQTGPSQSAISPPFARLRNPGDRDRDRGVGIRPIAQLAEIVGPPAFHAARR